jgi:hypothetical protein
MKYRIVKYEDRNYGVERKGWLGWSVMHSTPGFESEEKARAYIRRLTRPDVLAKFDASGSEVA